jgi:short-subunit dehydrogenase involved in D-alanine esterification of teichoic acids
VAVVTGANKGIGLEIVRQLAKEGITVVLTARDASRGKDALAYLKGQGLNNVNFHPLDVGSDESIKRLTEWLRTTYGGIDILVKSKLCLWKSPNFFGSCCVLECVKHLAFLFEVWSIFFLKKKKINDKSWKVNSFF